MKRSLLIGALAALALAFAPAVAAQLSGILKGQVRDFQGNPLPGATVIIKHVRGAGEQSTVRGRLGEKGGTGRVFEVTTDENGKFVQSGLQTGIYTLTVRIRIEGEAEDRDVFAREVGVQSGLEVEVNLNLQALLAEELERKQREEEEVRKFEDMRASFDAGVAALEQARQLQIEMRGAPAAERAQRQAQFEQQWRAAVLSLESARDKITDAQDHNLHLLHAKLGEAYELAGRPEDAVASYRRAVEGAPKGVAKADLARYYNNLGNVLARLGKLEEATEAYQGSAKLHPAGAAQAWTNLGIVLHNVGKSREAVEPLRKALAIDRDYALAWYALGSALLAQVETSGEGDRMNYVVPPGTAEAYQRYLQLEPDGPHADDARAVLQSLEALGARVDVKYSRPKRRN